MIINNNLSAINANRMVKIQNENLNGTMSKLASGEKINRAGDDASGLAVSEKMRAQISGLKTASRNASDGITFIQTTDGYLNETQRIIVRVRELAVQASNGIYTTEDRMQIQAEVSQLVSEIDRIASQAEYNGLNLLTGRFAVEGGTSRMWFQVGANAGQGIEAFIGNMTAEGLGLTRAEQSLSISSISSAGQTIQKIDDAISVINKQRADLGAYQNRMEYIVKGLDIAAENLQAAESQIRDTDMAMEAAMFSRDQILANTSIAMLAQANAKNQSVLRLLN